MCQGVHSAPVSADRRHADSRRTLSPRRLALGEMLSKLLAVVEAAKLAAD
jgi:hypothetical protein